MMDQLGTPEMQKRKIAFPLAGAHVISSDLMSGAVPEVRTATYAFAEEIIGLNPVK
jgi:hypothetical protein